MINEFSMLMKKYSIPAIFFVLGLLMLIVGISQNQDSTFMVAAGFMFVAGILSIMYSTGRFKAQLLYMIGIVAGIAGLFTIYMSWKSVSDTSTYNANYKYAKSLAKQNLEDVRYIEKAYADAKGKYTDDWEELVKFTKTGTIPYVDAQGVVPDRKIDNVENAYLYTGNPPIDNKMSDDEAYRLSKWMEGPNWQKDFSNFKRDTIQVSLLKNKFMSRSYMESREKAGFHRFSADSLPFIPFTNAKKMWKIETKDSVKVGDAYLPAIYVAGKIPFAKIKGKDNDTEEMYFGSLTTGSLDGSWEEE